MAGHILCSSFSLKQLSNNKATIVTIRDNEFFFSYTTLIGFRGFVPAEGGGERAYVRVRLDNTFSKTTGRHINEMGIQDFAIVTTDEFASLIEAVA
jgi:hypothetical protein